MLLVTNNSSTSSGHLQVMVHVSVMHHYLMHALHFTVAPDQLQTLNFSHLSVSHMIYYSPAYRLILPEKMMRDGENGRLVQEPVDLQ